MILRYGVIEAENTGKPRASGDDPTYTRVCTYAYA